MPWEGFDAQPWVYGGDDLVLLGCGEDPASTPPSTFVSFPAAIDPQCRDGKAKIFDECGDQSVLFTAALAKANTQGKVLLVEYGAEWCIWCHVFDAHINGKYGRLARLGRAHRSLRVVYGRGWLSCVR